MSRYDFLNDQGVRDALDQLENALLAARDGDEVRKIIMAMLTQDEQLKLGRRLMVASMLRDGYGYREISDTMKVGRSTIQLAARLMRLSPDGYELLLRRSEKVSKQSGLKEIGGSGLVLKRKKYVRKEEIKR